MSPRPALVLAGVTLAVTLLAAWLVYGTVSGEALLGFDGYPLIAASAFHSIVDPLAVFGDELMGGRYPDGRFYRPIVHLTFGVDHALGGLDPAQYARTDIALAALTSTFLGLLASALAGARGWTAAAVTACAAATYLLHPAQLEVVPYAPRRADALAVLFTVAAALAVVRDARPLWTALLALCALLSKESGVIVVPVTFAAALCRPEARDVRAALRSAAGPAAGVVTGMVLRTIVLGGLGGHAESGAPGTGSLGGITRSLWEAVAAGSPGGGALLGILAAAALALLGARGAGPGRTTALLVVLWAGAAVAITSFSGRFHDWYALGLVAPLAVLGGVAAGGARRAAGIPIGLAILGLVVTGHLGSPQRDTLGVAQAVSADQSSRFVALLEATAPGTTATFEPWVFAVSTAPGAPPVFVHAPYSLSALGELILGPDVEVICVAVRPPLPPPDLIHVQLIPGPPPAATLAPR